MDSQALIDYFMGDELPVSVWSSKYRDKGEITPDDMHLRLSKEFARIRYGKDQSKSLASWTYFFFELFKDFRYIIPQGRVMAGLGVIESYRSLSNCLRLPPPKDSYSSIMRTDTMLVSAAKRGCGYGIGLSNLRSSGAVTHNSSNTSTGVTSFGQRYSNSTNEVGQEGRRGACLLDLDIRHLDAFEWSTIKLDKTKLTGANISFKMRNDFMQAVIGNDDYILRFPVDKTPVVADKLEYNRTLTFVNPLDENVSPVYAKKIKAQELWNSIIHGVWSDGCPGLQFWERIIGYDPVSVYKKYEIDGSNACGEQPKAVFDSCRLLTLNLFSFVIEPFRGGKINYDLLYEVSYQQMLLGDDLVDLEIEYVQRIIDKVISDPEPESEKTYELELWTNVLDMAKSGRRVGCGITGLADMLAGLGLAYDSDEALTVADKVMKTKMKAELNATIDMAGKYGFFEGYDPHLEFRIETDEDEYYNEDIRLYGKNAFYSMLAQEFPGECLRMIKSGRRNVNWSTIAPTGTLSILAKVGEYANISSGCEPQFALYYFRNKKVDADQSYDFIDEVGIRWKQYPVMMGAFKEWYQIFRTEHPGFTNKELDDLTKDDLSYLSGHHPWRDSTANNIDWRKRIDMQAVLQKYTTSAISSTINLPNNIKESVISDLYMYAWEKGLKGITCYRDGSKGGVLVKDSRKEGFNYKDAVKRPKTLTGNGYTVRVKGEEYMVLVGLLDEKPYEIFASKNTWSVPTKFACDIIRKGKTKYTINIKDVLTIEDFNSEVTDEEAAITRLISISLRHGVSPKFISQQLNKTSGSIVAFDKAISRVLSKYIEEELTTDGCPECGEKIIRIEGCEKCSACSYSRC